MPARVQTNPTGREVINVGSKIVSRTCSKSVRELKDVVESQHVKLPVPGLHEGSFLRTGVVEAVTLPAKAMAVTKETRDL